VDGDGIPWRTLPGTHPNKGSYFTRGTTRDPYARYSERGPDYIYNMERLMRKFQTAAGLVPQPLPRPASKPAQWGVIYYGSTAPAMEESFAQLAELDLHFDGLRLRAYPFPASVKDFIDAHDKVLVVEQNRDAQMRTLLIHEFDLNPADVLPVLHFDGTPITARFITSAIQGHLAALDAHQRAAAPEAL
jgi:2-oxoglutarate ferredoxin oxidoreductase subunit alpha